MNHVIINLDVDINWYDYGARFYDPALGRWHVPEPFGEFFSSQSPYSYVFNSPVNYYDPFGLYPKKDPEPEGMSGGYSHDIDWPSYEGDIEPPFGSTIGNNIGRWSRGDSRFTGSVYSQSRGEYGYWIEYTIKTGGVPQPGYIGEVAVVRIWVSVGNRSSVYSSGTIGSTYNYDFGGKGSTTGRNTRKTPAELATIGVPLVLAPEPISSITGGVLLVSAGVLATYAIIKSAFEGNVNNPGDLSYTHKPWYLDPIHNQMKGYSGNNFRVPPGGPGALWYFLGAATAASIYYDWDQVIQEMKNAYPNTHPSDNTRVVIEPYYPYYPYYPY
jgi:RHS repeat-associated protein